MGRCPLLVALRPRPRRLESGPHRPKRLLGEHTWQVRQPLAQSHKAIAFVSVPAVLMTVLSGQRGLLTCGSSKTLKRPCSSLQSSTQPPLDYRCPVIGIRILLYALPWVSTVWCCSRFWACVSSLAELPYQESSSHTVFPVAGARSLLYGSALGIGGVVLVGALGLRALDVRSPAELRERLRGAAQPLGDSMRENMSPVKARLQVGSSIWVASLIAVPLQSVRC